MKRRIIESVLIAAAIAVVGPDAGFAQDLVNSVNEVHKGLAGLPNVVAGAFYIGGASMIGAGALKLKAHAENPGQHTIGHGLGRIVAGSCLISLPAFASWLNTSLAVGSGTVSSVGLGTIQ